MENGKSITPSRWLALAAAALVVKVTVSVVVDYRHYLPPNFDADFLLGRQAYFWGGYQWAFYIHLLAGPASLLLGLVLMGEGLRSVAPWWHRRLGRIQAANVLLLLTPSGLWMAWYAQGGAVAGAGLAILALATAGCLVAGWRAAVVHRYADHRRWMTRTFLLLSSAVVIRMIGGAATLAQVDALWLYPLSCWVSWLAPLAAYEIWRPMKMQRPVEANVAVRT